MCLSARAARHLAASIRGRPTPLNHVKRAPRVSAAAWRSLQDFVGFCDVRLVEQRIRKRPQDVDAADSQGYTPLMSAAGNGNAAAVECLLEAGASVAARDCNGKTAFHHAASQPAAAAWRRVPPPRPLHRSLFTFAIFSITVREGPGRREGSRSSAAACTWLAKLCFLHLVTVAILPGTPFPCAGAQREAALVRLPHAAPSARWFQMHYITIC